MYLYSFDIHHIHEVFPAMALPTIEADFPEALDGLSDSLKVSLGPAGESLDRAHSQIDLLDNESIMRHTGESLVKAARWTADLHKSRRRFESPRYTVSADRTGDWSCLERSSNRKIFSGAILFIFCSCFWGLFLAPNINSFGVNSSSDSDSGSSKYESMSISFN